MNDVLFVIPARSGSVGVKNKNIISWKGKPLIMYSFDFLVSQNIALENSRAVNTMNLANLNTQQTEKTSAIAHPSFPYLFNSQKYTINAGAIPKLTKSVNESNSFPKSDVPLINLATLPSKPSKIAATIKNKTAKL